MKAYLSKIIGEEFPIIKNSRIEINDWTDYAKFLNCELFTVVSIEYKEETLSLFIDDEGLLKPNFGREIFNYPEPLFGNIIICGDVDSNGETLPIPKSISLMDIDEIIGGIKYATQG